MQQIATGLSVLHDPSLRLIHCDIKPSNGTIPASSSHLLITLVVVKALNQEPAVWKLIDFGCASEGTFKSLVPATGTKGTRLYLSPEMSRGDSFTNKVDVWGLGCILYELCTGSKAFQSQSSLYHYVNSTEPAPQLLRATEEPEATIEYTFGDMGGSACYGACC